jgi:hypothetical protein
MRSVIASLILGLREDRSSSISGLVLIMWVLVLGLDKVFMGIIVGFRNFYYVI